MNNADRLSRQQYAAKYDEHAGSLYKFALCVTGDKKLAEAAMAKLFREGYADAENENFLMHMLEVLRRILESCPPVPDSYRENMKSVFPRRNQAALTDLLCELSVKQRTALLQKLMFENAMTKTA